MEWNCPKCQGSNVDTRNSFVLCVHCGRTFDKIEQGSPVAECIVQEYRPPFTVKLDYFTLSGKYYSEGEYQTQKLQMYEIFQEVKAMLAAGKRPGLVDGANEFYAVVTVPDHPHAHPALIVPRERI